MNTSSTNPESPDELDRLMSAFFKAQLKHPWPNAPVPTSGAARTATEPSELVAARTGTAPRNNAPAPARPAKGHDNTARARFTLAASVALMLGTCWYMSNGFRAGRAVDPVPPQNGPRHVPGQRGG